MWCCSTIAVSPRRVDRLASWCRRDASATTISAAIACARQLPGVDPERIVLWGISFSGGHVVRVAAEDGRIAAAMSVTPAVDGLAVLAQLARNAGVLQLLRVAAHGLRDAIRALTRRPPHLVPVIGEPGSRAIIAKRGAEQEYTRITGPSWRNELCARTALGVAFNRPIKFASRVSCPLLVQAGTADSITPPARARRAAASAGAAGSCGNTPSTTWTPRSAPRSKLPWPISWISCAATWRRPRPNGPRSPPPIGITNEDQESEQPCRAGHRRRQRHRPGDHPAVRAPRCAPGDLRSERSRAEGNRRSRPRPRSRGARADRRRHRHRVDG